MTDRVKDVIGEIEWAHAGGTSASGKRGGIAYTYVSEAEGRAVVHALGLKRCSAHRYEGGGLSVELGEPSKIVIKI